MKEGEEGEGVPGQGSMWTLSRENGGTQGRGWGPHQQVMERMESGNQPWTVRAAGEPGPPEPQRVQEGEWSDPRGRAVVVAEGQGCTDVPQPRFPGLASPGIKLSLSPHPVLSSGFLLARHAEKLELRGPLKRPHGSESRGRKGMGGPGSGGGVCQLAGGPGPAPQPPGRQLEKTCAEPM